MGCDIHVFVEKKMTDGSWDYFQEIDVGRDYDLFGFLAGVRYGDIQHFEQKGVPDDISDGVRKELHEWGSDGHSHSWLTLEELQTVDWDDDTMLTLSGLVDNDDWKKFEESNYDYNKVSFSYWQLGGDPKTSSYHEWKYPRKLEFAEFIKDVVKYLETFSGKPDEIRIVFWFDN